MNYKGRENDSVKMWEILHKNNLKNFEFQDCKTKNLFLKYFFKFKNFFYFWNISLK